MPTNSHVTIGKNKPPQLKKKKKKKKKQNSTPSGNVITSDGACSTRATTGDHPLPQPTAKTTETTK